VEPLELANRERSRTFALMNTELGDHFPGYRIGDDVFDLNFSATVGIHPARGKPTIGKPGGFIAQSIVERMQRLSG
jgi:hypothetical protein